MLANSGILRGAGIAAAAGAIPFGFQLPSGEQVTIALSSDNSATVPAVDAAGGYTGSLLNHAGENYWSEYWAYAKTVYVRYSACVEMPARPASQFIANTLALIDGNAVETLVIDFRNNGGGSDGVFMPLVTGIQQRMKTLRANRRFRMYTLINGATFSAALDGAMYLKLSVIPASMGILGPPGSAGAASILVGEPTGGKPGEYGNVKGPIILPASRLSLYCSQRWFPVLDGIPDRDSLYPDVAVNVRSTDYFARHDAILAAALAHASASPTAPGGRAVVVNSASFRYETGTAAGSFASAFGNFPLGDLKAVVNGATARLLGATSTQVAFVVPPETPLGMAALEVTLGGSVVSDGQFEVTAAGPGLFVAAANPAQPGAVLNQGNTLNTAAAPAAHGSLLQIFATGYGRLDASGSAPVSVWIANRPAEILYSGPAPGIDGLWQINARVPADTAIAKQVPLFISAEGLVSNGVTIYVADR
jgi:uncharacterized protein (TIGR03437 family)